MMKLLSVALAAVLCASASAQRGPKLEQSIAVGDVKMSLNYTSPSYGGGKTVEMLNSKEGGEMRGHMNQRMSAQPIAAFTSSVDVKCGTLTLPAGEHQVYFSIGDDLKWNINFKMGDKVQSMPLTLTPSGEHTAPHLLMCLYPEPKGAGCYVAFGKMQAMLAFEPAGTAKADASGKKPEAGK